MFIMRNFCLRKNLKSPETMELKKMNVKELREWLKRFNDEDLVGGYDVGQDSGDWVEYSFPEKALIKRDFIIKNKREIAKQ